MKKFAKHGALGAILFVTFTLLLARRGHLPGPVLGALIRTQQYADRQLASREDSACQLALIDAGVDVTALPPMAYPDKRCYLRAGVALSPGPYRYRYAPSGELTSPHLNCEMAERLRRFETEIMGPLAQKILGQSIVEIRHQGSFYCRAQRSMGEALSEHSFGQAFDFNSFELADGSVVSIQRDYTSPGPRGEFLRQLAREACDFFGTALGPPFNADHADHLHVSVGFFGKCAI